MTPPVLGLDDILQRRAVWRGRGLVRTPAGVTPSGFAALDCELPGGGWPGGGLTEIFSARDGVGELQLLLPALVRLTAAGRRVVWLAPPHLPYAPALVHAGVSLEHLTVVRAPGRRDALWAAEQVLRAGSCHALLAWMPDIRHAELRRLAVAAEAGGSFVALFRPLRAAQTSSPACLRILLEPRMDGLALRILKRRGVPCAGVLTLSIHRPVDVIHVLGGAPLSAPGAREPAARACAV